MMLPLYIERIRAGSVSPTAHPTVVTNVGAIAVLDGQHGLGQVAGMSRPDAAAKRILPIAASDIAMSRITGAASRCGMAIASGLLPTTRVAPPGAGMSGLVLHAATPTRP